MNLAKSISVFLALLVVSAPYDAVTAASIDSGKEIFIGTIKAADSARKGGTSDRELSHILLKGAGQCRDEGYYYYAIELFETALQADPTNAHVYRVYGDFIMGYRGLYEYAATKYFRANELVKLESKSYDDTFKKALKRSMQIWHRDGQDGLPALNTYSAKDISLYFEPSIEFRKPTTDHEERLSSFETQLKVEGLIDKTINGSINDINNNPLLTPQQRAALIVGEEQTRAGRKKDIPNRLHRRVELLEKKGSVLLRFGDPNLPYLRFRWNKVEIDPLGIDIETFEERDGEFNGFSLLMGKNLYLSHQLDLNLEAEFFESEIIGFPILGVGTSKEESENYDFDLQSQFTYYFETNTLKLTLGGGFRGIERTEENGKKFPDSSNSQRAVLRLSLFKAPQETENPTRFRGRRSSHYEIGLRRHERDFETATTAFDYIPHATIEQFGLLAGHLDLNFNYNLITRKYTSDTEGLDVPTPVALKGKYDSHQFRVIPTWVFIYDLYEDTFKQGIEFLSLGVPLTYTLGEKAGAYSRFNAGIKIEGQWEVWRGLRILPIIESDYAYYPELNRDDWGIFAKCSFRY